MSTLALATSFELAHQRNVLFAVELLDAVSLARVWQGVTLVAEGLRGKPVVNAGGLFVWLREDFTALTRITINTGALPLQGGEITAADVTRPLHTLELAPRASYPFDPGTTALRASLIESRVTPPVPIADAEVRLVWLDDDGLTWRDAPTRSRTNDHGDFAAVLRLAAAELPRFDASGAITVRLRVRRAGQNEIGTPPFQIAQGRVAYAPAYAWDELQP